MNYRMEQKNKKMNLKTLQRGIGLLAILCGSIPLATATFAADDFGGTLTGVSISDADGTNQPPVAEFTYTQDGDTFTFDAGDSYDPDGTISTYTWDFGDGTTNEGITAIKTFTASSYVVTLSVVDTNSGVHITQKEISITTAITDDFNRTASDLGSNWTTVFGSPIVENTVVRTSTSTNSGAIWSADSFTDDQYAQIALSDGGANYTGAACRMDGSGNGYAIRCTSNTSCRIQKVVAGTFDNFGGATGGVSVSDVANKTLKITCEGTTITGYLDDVPFDSHTDSTYTSGNPGITVYNTWTKGADNFEAGDL